MQHHWRHKLRGFYLLVIATIISACGNEQPAELHSGTYLPQDINVQFQHSKTDFESETSAQASLRNAITEQLLQSYFIVETPSIKFFIEGEESQGVITPENIVLSQFATLQLTPQKTGSIIVSSSDHLLCQKNQCNVQFTLIKTSIDDPKIQAIQNPSPDLSTTVSESEIALPQIDLPTLFNKNFWGIMHEISDNLTLKLSPIQSNGLIYGAPEHTEMEAFDLGDITIDPQDSQVEILSFYSNAAPSSEVHQIESISYLFILPMAKEPTLNLMNIDSENPHYYADEKNLLAKDTTGFYGIQYRYFPKIKRLVIALTESVSLEEIQQHLQAINTLNTIDNKPSQTTATSKSQDHNPKETQTILLTDINESLKTLQERYQISLAEMFRVKEIQDNYRQTVKELLTSSDLFLKTGPTTQNGYHLFTQYFGDYRFNETYLKIHNESLKNVIAAVQTLNNSPEKPSSKNSEKETNSEQLEDLKGLWKNPIYIYSVNPREASGISYFKEIQPGVTLEIFSPAFQGHIAEKVLFAKLLEGISWKNMPKLSKNTISNIAKYNALPQDPKIDNQDNNAPTPEIDQAIKFYEFKEGKTDLQGTLQKNKS